MQNKILNHKIISHLVTAPDLAVTLENIKARIIKAGDKANVTVEQQLQILAELSSFDLGRFLLLHQGANGFWTHYFLTYPWYGAKTGLNNAGKPFSKIESFLLNKAPMILATQQRFILFLKENQKFVKENAKLACIPCGMMGELLYLNYAGINAINLVGIDLDAKTIEDAKDLAQKNKLLQWTKFLLKDAWHLDIVNEFDLISSNGLNIYEPNDEKIYALYESFYQALAPNGALVTSFLTYPPHLTSYCEWDMQKINLADLSLQAIIFKDVLDAKWLCFSSSSHTEEQLKKVGFKDIRFIYDEARMFPTVVAKK